MINRSYTNKISRPLSDVLTLRIHGASPSLYRKISISSCMSNPHRGPQLTLRTAKNSEGFCVGRVWRKSITLLQHLMLCTGLVTVCNRRQSSSVNIYPLDIYSSTFKRYIFNTLIEDIFSIYILSIYILHPGVKDLSGYLNVLVVIWFVRYKECICN